MQLIVPSIAETLLTGHVCTVEKQVRAHVWSVRCNSGAPPVIARDGTIVQEWPAPIDRLRLSALKHAAAIVATINAREA